MPYNGYLNPWVPMIRDAFARGISVKKIAKTLVESGVKPPFSDDPSRYYNTIYTIIRGSVLKISKPYRGTYVPQKSWTLQDNYEEIEKEYKW